MSNTVDNRELDRAFRKAAEWVAYSWPGVVEPDDLSQELWIWYLESPYVQKKVNGLPEDERAKFAHRQAKRIASDKRDSDARFSNQVQYSVDDIKNALEGHSLWRELVDDLSAGLESLRERYEPYAEAIESRYFRKIMPQEQSERDRLKNAHRTLTDEVNRVVREKFDRFDAVPGRTLGDGPGTRTRVFPEASKPLRTVFDDEFRGEEMSLYRGWALDPEDRPARLENWEDYEREDFPR